MKNEDLEEKRVVLHVDMDYFFAQIEERENPRFRGKPLIVGADPKKGAGRGVVSTCNYEARKYGIKSGMPISRSYKLCPEGVFLPVNMPLYKRVSSSIFQIIEKETEKIERVSLDEAYLDLTKKVKNLKEAESIGKKIKEKIKRKEDLTCSVGVGKNKMMAKIACEEAKPDGIKVIFPKDSSKVILKKSVEIIPGIGIKRKKEIENYLKKKDVTVADAKKIKKENLEKIFGKLGKEFYWKFRGVDCEKVGEKKETKSKGKEYTFQKDTYDPKKIIKIFRYLVFQTIKEVGKQKVKGVVVTCRFEDFETHTKQTSFPLKFYKKKVLYKKGVSLLLHLITKTKKRIRLLGFRLILER